MKKGASLEEGHILFRIIFGNVKARAGYRRLAHPDFCQVIQLSGIKPDPGRLVEDKQNGAI